MPNLRECCTIIVYQSVVNWPPYLKGNVLYRTAEPLDVP